MKVYDIFKSKQARKYVEMCKERAKLFLQKQDETPEFVEEYKAALEDYRNLLDRRNFKMPSPKWQYMQDDKTTWPYLSCIEKRKNGVIFAVKWVVNPDFQFNHLL